MPNLLVPYFSQWDPNANASNDDCGPTCISMILSFYGTNISPNDIFAKTGAAKEQLITIQQMQNAVASIGFLSTYKVGLTVDNLKAYLDQGIPVIALVHMGDFNSRQDKNFAGGHLVVVVGYRDDGYFVNDPDFKDQFRQDGDHHFYTKQEFESAWSDCHLDDNPDNSLLIVQPAQKGTFVDEATFIKLVTKATSTDTIGHYLNFPQDQIDAVEFGNAAIEKIKELQDLAFTQPKAPEANSEPSNQPSQAPQSGQQPIITPDQANQVVNSGGFMAFISSLFSIFKRKEVKN